MFEEAHEGKATEEHSDYAWKETGPGRIPKVSQSLKDRLEVTVQNYLLEVKQQDTCQENMDSIIFAGLADKISQFCLQPSEPGDVFFCGFFKNLRNITVAALLSRSYVDPYGLLPASCFLPKHRTLRKKSSSLVDKLFGQFLSQTQTEPEAEISCHDCMKQQLAVSAEAILKAVDCREGNYCDFVTVNGLSFAAQLLLLQGLERWSYAEASCRASCPASMSFPFAEVESREKGSRSFEEAPGKPLQAVDEFLVGPAVSRLSLQRRNPTDSAESAESVAGAGQGSAEKGQVSGYRLHSHRGMHWGRMQENMDETVSQWLAEKNSRRRRKGAWGGEEASEGGSGSGRGDRQLSGETEGRRFLEVGEKESLAGEEGRKGTFRGSADISRLMKHLKGAKRDPEKTRELLKKLQRLSHRAGVGSRAFSPKGGRRGRHLRGEMGVGAAEGRNRQRAFRNAGRVGLIEGERFLEGGGWGSRVTRREQMGKREGRLSLVLKKRLAKRRGRGRGLREVEERAEGERAFRKVHGGEDREGEGETGPSVVEGVAKFWKSLFGGEQENDEGHGWRHHHRHHGKDGHHGKHGHNHHHKHANHHGEDMGGSEEDLVDLGAEKERGFALASKSGFGEKLTWLGEPLRADGPISELVLMSHDGASP